MDDEAKDPWAEWMLRRRDGGDPDVLERRLPILYELRDRVLDNARIRPGDILLDVGSGTGLVGFGAIDRVGPSGRVIFSDVSRDLLDECRRIAADLDVLDRCDFHLVSADDLGTIPDGSVDVVTTRSVLIYLSDKRPAFGEVARVLRPGGRVSVFEPINRFEHPPPAHTFLGFDVSPVWELAEKVEAQQLPADQHPLLNFDERDLLRFAEEAGFCPIRLDYTAEISVTDTAITKSWDTMKRISGNPLDPTLEEAMDAALTPAEKERFERHLRPLVENGVRRHERSAFAYLSATKPAGGAHSG
jgi:arsenite methyltransferase